MYCHQMYPGGPELIFVDGDWPDVLPDKSNVGLTVVRKNPNSHFNLNSRFAALVDCVPYNIAFSG